MLCRRKLELHTSPSSVPHTLIPRQMLEDSNQANSLLERAKAQAEEHLHQAEQQREALLEEASVAFWRRAEAQLDRWERERQSMSHALEQHATTVTNNVIRYLLGEVPDQQRLTVMLKQLLASQLPPVEATLLCHPDELNALESLLAPPHATLWMLRSDDTIRPQTLVLKTDEGDFRIDWASMFSLLLTQQKHAVPDAPSAPDVYEWQPPRNR
ncbi:type III secretion system stator protein SctL [Pseudomonas tolaasii]|uniref:type III secretion system stator protein SctL n=1 Tax=Pseudomonas tolaasii TaxID=29442 RepID=UPI0015A0E61A|nr:type III secretion system stator protein SctL [Pseudomonas tolaasii]NVZ47773.1 type III secretion system stator protein SctL [Pseudomonas tolaasii]NWA48225.1 type III secretion system stator protein SctL [Pseudomonas tolaasii]